MHRSLLLAAVLALGGCAGGMPLMHPAKTLPAGEVQLGAGVAGQLTGVSTSGDLNSSALDELAVAPGVAPWASGRVGISGDNEGQISYSGRSVRAGFRHAFPVGPLHLSAGVGGNALLPRALDDNDVTKAFGGGADVPLILGWSSTADLYSVWGGARGGFNILSGQVLPSRVDAASIEGDNIPFKGRSWFMGGLVGASVGFRTFHATLEVDVSYLRADGTFGEEEVGLDQLVISPGGAFNVSF